MTPEQRARLEAMIWQRPDSAADHYEHCKLVCEQIDAVLAKIGAK